MKKSFDKRKIIFSLFLIITANLVPIYAIGTPGKRTYIGRETAIETEISKEKHISVIPNIEKQVDVMEEVSRQDSEPQFLENRSSLENDADVTGQVSQVRNTRYEALVEEFNRMAKGISSGEDTAIESNNIPIINHEGVPLDWKYKME